MSLFGIDYTIMDDARRTTRMVLTDEIACLSPIREEKWF